MTDPSRHRNIADYDPATVFDVAETREQVGEVRAFGAEVLAWLCSEGWVS